MKTKIIAVTGGMGTGKSTVSWMFVKLGLTVIDADELAHEALNPGSNVWKMLFKRYGNAVMGDKKMIDRQALGRLAFDDEAERKFLEEIIHPHVKNEIERKIAGFAKSGHSHIIVEVPLLFEVGWEKNFDAVIVVHCTMDREIERCMKKFNLSKEDAEKRISTQLLLGEKIKKADAVIDNDGDLEETRVQVERLFRRMKTGKFPELGQ